MICTGLSLCRLILSVTLLGINLMCSPVKGYRRNMVLALSLCIILQILYMFFNIESLSVITWIILAAITIITLAVVIRYIGMSPRCIPQSVSQGETPVGSAKVTLGVPVPVFKEPVSVSPAVSRSSPGYCPSS